VPDEKRIDEALEESFPVSDRPWLRSARTIKPGISEQAYGLA
jgi:hypothetical protein